MSFGFELSKLVTSIKKFGLINAPLLRKDGDGKLTIISGYRRILALKSMGMPKVACRILSESEITPLECLVLNLYDNLSSRELNVVEKAMVLSRLSEHMTEKEVKDQYMSLLDLQAHSKTLQFYLRIEGELNSEIKDAIVTGGLNLRAVKKMLEMDRHSRYTVFNIIQKLKLNMNQQIQYIELINDISRINGKKSSDIVEAAAFQETLSNRRLNNPQRAKALLEFLRNSRYPSLSKAERTFKKMIENLRLPAKIRISHPPYFEKSDYLLEILFKDGNDLKEKLRHLWKEQDISRLCDPWERWDNT
jgi:ParB family chromosome partitioning protein